MQREMCRGTFAHAYHPVYAVTSGAHLARANVRTMCGFAYADPYVSHELHRALYSEMLTLELNAALKRPMQINQQFAE